MICPKCAAWARVIETRWVKSEFRTRRRYECGNLHRFNTYEALPTAQNHKSTIASVASWATRNAARWARDKAIQALVRAGATHKSVAAMYGIHASVVTRITRRKL